MKKAVVVMGGPSAEHEISLATGREMLLHLDNKKYTPRAVVISNDKQFFYSDTKPSLLKESDYKDPEKSSYFAGPFLPISSLEIWDKCDVVILALHGEFGEDGKIQGFFDTLGIPYTGSGVYSSAVGMEKIASKMLFEQHGITTPPYSIYRIDGSGMSIDEIVEKHGFPCYVKCPQSGSSRLMGRAESKKSLEKMLMEFSKHSSSILIETAISGEEYSCPVLDYPDGTAKPLLPILIKPVDASFFDFTAKYTDGACEEIVPAPCSDELTDRMQQVALKTHLILKCSGVSRTDMIVKDDVIYTLEINTLPGFTSASLAPKSFAAMGGTFAELLDIIIENALAGKKK